MNKNIIFTILILSLLASVGISTAEAGSNGILPVLMFPYFVNQNQSGGEFVSNYLMWAMIFNYPPFDSSVYNSYSSGSTTYINYAPESEEGWSVMSPIEYKIEETYTGEYVIEELGFVEPDVPEGYILIDENEGILPEQAMNEAESSNSATSSDGVESSDISDNSGDSGGFDSGYDSGGSDFGGDFSGGE